MIKLSFLGGAGTVTGSKFLAEHRGCRVLVDCGLFQGPKELRLRNWAPFSVDPQSIGAVLLTHAHLDHTGYLPLLVRAGFAGPVYCSRATADLAQILLRDSAHVQELDADYANRHGYSKHKPALPLYTQADAEHALGLLEPVDFNDVRDIIGGATMKLRRAGHILGAATIELDWHGRRTIFSGDLGRYDDPLIVDPAPAGAADYLLVESTYGNRLHDRSDPEKLLGDTIATTVRRGGTVIIPAFAVGRAQMLLFHLHRLKAAGQLTNVPVFLDSPMATNATEIFCHHMGDHRLSSQECRDACGIVSYVRDAAASKALTANPVPKVIISASGMATGGRVLHHLKHYAPDPRNSILFAGFQAAGTRGAAIVAGASSVKIHGQQVPVRAVVKNLEMLSAHADADEIVQWLGGFPAPPKMTYITHGEPSASEALRTKIEAELHWPCTVAAHGQAVELL